MTSNNETISRLSPQAGNVSIFSVKRVLLLAIGDHMIFGNDITSLPACKESSVR